MSIGLSALRSASPNFEAHLRRLCDKGQITSALDELTRAQETLSSPTYCYLLHTCLDAESYTLTKLLHSHLLAQATHLTPFVGNLWVTTFAKSGAIKEALQASISLPKIDVSSWTAIISAYAGYGCEREAFSVFQRMCDCGLEPSKFTLISLFKACGSLEDLSLGRMLHAYAQEKGIVLDVFASNTLLRMYGKCGAMLEAEAVFYHIASRTQTSWNAMLSTYVDLGYGELALKLYRQLQQEGLRSTSAPLEIARALHGDAYRMGYTSDNLIASALVHIYDVLRGCIPKRTNLQNYSSSNGHPYGKG
ncbi:hypothetical protein KP509_03G033500 [Ceratopteris richardii]|uniref:Pentatricopeptide repeat-containing protein n=1 Tax=Ceratopteris richardii TaxID=49495 RepID=A0A8T2UYI7_CERRI|nr:hypothetical protein KP509_03G033500 [Ceratopteris richardii]